MIWGVKPVPPPVPLKHQTVRDDDCLHDPSADPDASDSAGSGDSAGVDVAGVDVKVDRDVEYHRAALHVRDPPLELVLEHPSLNPIESSNILDRSPRIDTTLL